MSIALRKVLKTYGVSAVANEIQVKPLFKKTDTDIASAALDALPARVDVPDDKIKLAAKDGWITLEGNVDWYLRMVLNSPLNTCQV